MAKFEEVKPEITLLTPDSSLALAMLDEFRVNLDDSDGGRGESVILAAGKTKRTTINKAVRTLERLIRELKEELNDEQD